MRIDDVGEYRMVNGHPAVISEIFDGYAFGRYYLPSQAEKWVAGRWFVEGGISGGNPSLAIARKPVKGFMYALPGFVFADEEAARNQKVDERCLVLVKVEEVDGK